MVRLGEVDLGDGDTERTINDGITCFFGSKFKPWLDVLVPDKALPPGPDESEGSRKLISLRDEPAGEVECFILKARFG